LAKKLFSPDFVFESSWEVCNKVGGIYTVLSTRAKTLVERMGDQIVFIGPDFWRDTDNPQFKEEKPLLTDWRKYAEEVEHLHMRIGRWQVPGKPVCVLVDFNQYYQQKNDIYAWAWENYQVDSLHAYGDYDEASMFSWAAGKVVESYYRFFNLSNKDRVVYQAHEWMTCLGALYVQQNCPDVATIFTTHATSIGRSIAGNNKPLYNFLQGYNGDQMAQELNMQSKHSIEKQTAHAVDCFTTVSEITNRECTQLLEKPADVVLMNGFEDDFVPKVGRPFDAARKKARKTLLAVANALMGSNLKDDTLIVSIGGRYEYKNKGIDMFVDSMNRLRQDKRLNRDVLAFILVPAWVKEPRTDLQRKLKEKNSSSLCVGDSRITHSLYNQDTDMVLSQMNWLGMHNAPADKVKVVFVPCYLDGHDGIFNMHYYELLVGMDLCIYPSYYEPWGYTPLESVAFHVPCITTDLAGFGLWVKSLNKSKSQLRDGVVVVHRNDTNFQEASDEIRDAVLEFAAMDNSSVEVARMSAAKLSELALWKHFITFYYNAYDVALHKSQHRNKNNKNK